MGNVTVRTWTGTFYLTAENNCFKTNYPKGERTIPFSQVVSFSLRDPKGAMRPGMIKINVGGAPDTMVRINSFLSVGNSNNIEFPHGYEYLTDGRKMQAMFTEWQNNPAPQAVAPAVVTQQPTAADEIRSLKGLLDDGIISQEEFDAKKKQLLGL